MKGFDPLQIYSLKKSRILFFYLSYLAMCTALDNRDLSLYLHVVALLLVLIA